MAEQVDLTTIPISPNGDKSDAAPSSEQDGNIVTVFHDKDNFNVKHPLQNRWTLWFTKPSSGKVSLLCAPIIASCCHYLETYFTSLHYFTRLTSLSTSRATIGMICSKK